MRKLIILILFSFFTISAKAQPITEWVQRYNSPGNYSDRVNDMAVDGQGNVYLTGLSNGDFLTIKYLSSGTLRWVKTYDGPYHGGDEAIAISLDKQKNIYVLGLSKNLYGKEVYAVVKYSNEGEQLWVREYINADSLGAYPKALTVDDSGNVYITGNCSKPNYISVFGTVKYNTNGIFQWERFFNGTANFGAIPYSITTDKNGNSYITGTTVDSGNIRPITTIKYDSSGNQKWIKKYFFQNNSYREGLKVQVDKNNYIYVGGNGKDEANTEYKFILIKYDTGGTEKWVRTYGCTSGYNPSAYLKDLTIDNYNNILVTGLSDSSQMGWDFTTLKYNSNGDWLWIKRYKKSFNSSDDVNAITVDRFNNVYVTGGTDNNTPWYQYLTVKYSQEGNFNWAMTYSDNNPYYYNHEAIKVKTDSAGNIYVTGNSDGIGTGLDIATIKYSGPSGIGSISNEIPAEYKLYQNYPNPFNNTTKIKYQIKSGVRNQESEVKIIVYDILGKEISSPVDRKQNSGIYEVMFDGSNLSTGIYFYRFIIDGIIIDNKKLVFVK